MSKIKFIIYRSDLNNLQTRQKKAKKYQLVGIALSINSHTKSPQTYCFSLGSCHNIGQFTGPIPKIYRYA